MWVSENAFVYSLASPSGRSPARLGYPILLLIVLATVVTGCRADDDRALLREGRGSATSCFPSRGDTHFILGDDALINTSAVPVTIDTVGLAGANNLVKIDAFLSAVPSRGPATLMGNVRGRPWVFYAKGQRALWRNRVPAPNTVVPPSSAGTDFNLLVLTRAPLPNQNSSARIEVRYHASGRSMVWQSIISYRAVPRRSCSAKPS